jgi:biopolymer transport protein ExbD
MPTMKTRLIVMTSILSALACGCGTVAPPVRTDPAPRHKGSDRQQQQRSSVLATCLLAVDDADPAKAWSLFARCLTASKVYAEPACNAAWATADAADPAARPRMIIDACSAAYCPKLADPKPRLCVSSKTLPSSFRRELLEWTEFHLRVLTPALGLERRPALLAKLAVYLSAFPSFGRTPPMKVTLPGLKGASTGLAKDLTVVVTRDGKFAVDGKAMTPEALTALLKAKHRAAPDTRILIAADKLAPHGAVVSLMDIAKSVGFKRLGVAVQKKD